MGDLPAQHGAQGGEDKTVEGRALGLQPAGRPLGRVQGPRVGDGGLGRQTEDLLLGSGSLGIGGVVDLLKDTRHGQNRGGPEGAQVRHQVAHVGHVSQHARVRAHDRDLHEPAEHMGQWQEQQETDLSPS